jgi:hypothetical protein
MHVSTLVRWGAIVTTVGLLGTACSDAPSAPRAARGFAAPSSTFSTSGSNKGKGKPDVDYSLHTESVVIDPSVATTLKFGSHEVYFPAYSICDPSTSTYGETEWEQPCELLRSPITITATWSSKYGHANIDFQPSMRFVPSSDPDRWVMLTMKDYVDADENNVRPILWYRPSDGKYVDESIMDPSLNTLFESSGNRVKRRVKHFSSFWVQAGETCDGGLYCLGGDSLVGWLVGS